MKHEDLIGAYSEYLSVINANEKEIGSCKKKKAEAEKTIAEHRRAIELLTETVQELEETMAKLVKRKLVIAERYITFDVRDGVIKYCKDKRIAQAKIDQIEILNDTIETSQPAYENYEIFIANTHIIIDEEVMKENLPKPCKIGRMQAILSFPQILEKKFSKSDKKEGNE
ncbi:MAG: hypothetical protein K0Q65_1061 [Clostridia bacterium]|jgi:vacuolar-type H+-ATPase subunit I/STV1|nr:hypothetical protein [Clostridia bacterium]